MRKLFENSSNFVKCNVTTSPLIAPCSNKNVGHEICHWEGVQSKNQRHVFYFSNLSESISLSTAKYNLVGPGGQ